MNEMEQRCPRFYQQYWPIWDKENNDETNDNNKSSTTKKAKRTEISHSIKQQICDKMIEAAALNELDLIENLSNFEDDKLQVTIANILKQYSYLKLRKGQIKQYIRLYSSDQKYYESNPRRNCGVAPDKSLQLIEKQIYDWCVLRDRKGREYNNRDLLINKFNYFNRKLASEDDKLPMKSSFSESLSSKEKREIQNWIYKFKLRVEKGEYGSVHLFPQINKKSK